MQYLLLIYADESKTPMPESPEAAAAMMEPWNAYTEALSAAGVMLGGNALHPVASATTVTAVNGQPVFTDGPFAETKEQLGGYYLLQCKDLDEAMAWAAKCPIVSVGRCEVRPVVDFSA